MTAPADKSERGAALVTVMMIVAAMSIVALGLTQLAIGQIQRAKALDSQSQIRLYAMSAEQVAYNQLSELLGLVDGKLTQNTPYLNQPVSVPVDGGVFLITVRDASNCFDLNRLVSGHDRAEKAPSAEAIEELRIILDAADFDRRRADEFIAGVVDWMDSDRVPLVDGAEDGYYSTLSPSYRPSGQPLASETELLAISGYARESRDKIEGLTCVRPPRAINAVPPLNINTLSEGQAPLLVPVFSGALSAEDARRLVQGRPTGGWTDALAFLEEPEAAKIAPELVQMQRLGTLTNMVEVHAKVSYRGIAMEMNYLFEIPAGQPIRLMSRERVG